MSNLKDVYKIRLRCSVCGASDCFECNDDKTYIKCVRCGKEYFGGYDELVEANQNCVDSLKEAISNDLKEDIMSSLRDAFKGCKNIKIR